MVVLGELQLLKWSTKREIYILLWVGLLFSVHKTVPQNTLKSLNGRDIQP